MRLSRSEKQAATRSALVYSARQHFAEHGYAGASLEKIAADAGFTRGAVYANFKDRAELFLAVLDDRVREQINELEAVGTDLAALSAWRRRNARAQRGLSLAVLEFRIAALRDEQSRKQLRIRDRALRHAFAALITRAADDLGIALPLPGEQVAAALLALGDGITQQHRVDPDGVDPATFEAVLAILMKASTNS